MKIKELYSIYKENPTITTDSRSCPEGSLFIALKGESFDGNKFAIQALEKGCRLAVVDDKEVLKGFEQSGLGEQGKRMVLVDDTLQAFKDLAREHRRQFNIPIIGITGTNGKTTTKELIRTVLAERYNVMATEGNFNNDVGVPKTLMRLNADHEIAVVEMGASHPGDIRTLAETAEPTCGLITNVGKAHLLGFGSLEGVLHTKGELYDNLASRDGSTIFINGDNDLLTSILPDRVAIEKYSRDESKADCAVYGKIVNSNSFLSLKWKAANDDRWHDIATHLVGAYNLDNVLAAVTVGRHFGVGDEEICHAIENYVPSNNRSQFIDTGRNKLVVDAYNANPTSMAAALDNFRLMQVTPKMAIIGEMRELGESSREEHKRLVENLEDCGLELVWLVGDEFADLDCPFRKFRDVEEVKKAIDNEDINGYNILIKGSNGNKLFQLPELL